ncbi:MAG: terpene synthase family protein [Myxococcales bacterium]|nr:terpene synthase family protein [Myxococcales bacterium]
MAHDMLDTGPRARTIASIDSAALELSADFFLREAGGTYLALSTPNEARSVKAIFSALQLLLRGRYSELSDVAAKYAVLTLRERYAREQAAFVYPLVLLGGWIWDDLVDEHGGHPELADLIAHSTQRIRGALAGQMVSCSSSSAETELSRHVDAVIELLLVGQPILQGELAPYSPRIVYELERFFASFADKARLSHHISARTEVFLQTRSVCVGMKPCYELSYAIKALHRGIGARELSRYLERPEVRRCEELATLHCAAVNDLFSIYKDREVEDTANLPAVLAPSPDLRGYLMGALATLERVRSWHAELRLLLAALPRHRARSLVEETLLHMMEGNVLFHLAVPRYAKGLDVVRDLVQDGFSPHQYYPRFEEVFRGPHRLPRN